MSSTLISQSEADSFLACQRKHYYAFGEPCADGSHGIAPKQHSDSLARGTIGHKFLENFYAGVKDGLSRYDAAHSALLEHNNDAVDFYKRTGNLTLYQEVTTIAQQYVEFYDTPQDFTPIALEHEFRYEMPNGVTFPFKPDMIGADHRGQIWVVDHKFLYNFYNERQLSIMPQLGKYVAALRHLGYTVRGAVYNQISTRKNSRSPFKREYIEFSDTKLATLMQEQETVAQRILHLKSMPNEVWRESVVRNASGFTCNHCMFLDLCVSDLNNEVGRAKMLETFFEPNSYGYGKGEDDASE